MSIEGLNLAKRLKCSLVLLLALAGCRSKPDIDWSTQAYSPDKHWLASAKRQAGGSFGGGYADTVVYLTQAEQQPLEILGIDRLLDKSSLQLNWIEPRHLEVIVDLGVDPLNPNELFFQAIKCGDVTISFEPVSHQKSAEKP